MGDRPGRQALEAVVRLRCPGRTRVHTGFLKNLSHAGMFLRILDPEPAGVRLGFDVFFNREDGSQEKLTGEGEVAWARTEFEGPDLPPGMGIHFLSIEPGGVEILSRLLASGDPAVLSSEESSPPEEEAPVTPPEYGEGVGMPFGSAGVELPETEEGTGEGDRNRFRLGLSIPTALIAFGLMIALGLGWWWTHHQGQEGMVAVVPLIQAVAETEEPLDLRIDDPTGGEGGLEAAVSPAVSDSAGETGTTESTVGDLGSATPPDPVVEQVVPARRVLDVRVEEAERVSLVSLLADGKLGADRVTASYIGGSSPRIVVQVDQVERFGDQIQIAKDEGLVRGVRTGYHTPDDGSLGRLHVVLEVVDAGIRVLNYQPSDDELLIYVGFQDGQ